MSCSLRCLKPQCEGTGPCSVGSKNSSERAGGLLLSQLASRLIRQWMVDPTTGPFPAGGSLFGPWGGHQAGPARSCSSGSTGEDGAERYSTGPSMGALPWVQQLSGPARLACMPGGHAQQGSCVGKRQWEASRSHPLVGTCTSVMQASRLMWMLGSWEVLPAFKPVCFSTATAPRGSKPLSQHNRYALCR